MVKKIYYLMIVMGCLRISSFAVTPDEASAVTNKSLETSGLYVGLEQLGNNPKGFKKGPDGLLYGVVGQGSKHTLYTFDPLTSSVQPIYELPEHFEVTDYYIESTATFYIAGYDPYSFETNTGYLFKILKVANQNLEILYSTRSDHQGLSILDGNDGRLYFNVASTAGGQIASILKDGDDYQMLHDFSDATRKPLDGSRPVTKLAILSGGALVGATEEGGSFDTGTIYRINKDGSGFTVVWQVPEQQDIYNNFGETFITASNGKTYGMYTNPINFFSLDSDGTNFQNVYQSPGFPSMHSNLVVMDSTLCGIGLYTQQQLEETQNPPMIDIVQFLPYGIDWNAETWGMLTDEVITLLGPVAEFNGTLYGTYRYPDGSTAILSIFSTFKKELEFSVAEPVLWGVNGTHTFHLETDGQNFDIAFQDKQRSYWGGDEIGFNSSFITHANNAIYGIQSTGSDLGSGSIFKIAAAGISRIQVLDENESTRASLADGGNGFVYGVGCAVGCSGTNLFRFSYEGDQFEQRRIVQYGMKTLSPLVRIKDYDMVVGMSSGGGAHRRGFIYRLQPDLSGLEILHSFSGPDGKAPTTKLAEGGDGFIYGMTTTGGFFNNGVIFKFKPGMQFTKVYQFSSSKVRGVNPIGNLVLEGDYLYGVCKASGSFKKGMIFRIRKDGTGFTRLFSFDGVTASDPAGDLILNEGFIYGSAKNKFFRIKTDGTAFTILKETNAVSNTLSCLMTPSGEAPIVMTNPADGSTMGYPFFSAAVTPVKYAATYTVEISADPEFNTIASSARSIYMGVREETIPWVNVSNLEFNTTYYARVYSSVWPNSGPITTFTTLPTGPRLFGLTRADGPGNCGLAGGSVFSIDTNGTHFIKHIDYSCRPAGKMLGADLFLGSDHYLYGMSGGIDTPGGEFFRFDQKGNFTVMIPNVNLWDPIPIIMGSDGNIYLLDPAAEPDDHSYFFSRLFRLNPNDLPPIEPAIFHDFSPDEGTGVVPIDPGDGNLYGIVAANKLYKINLVSGVIEIQHIFSEPVGGKFVDGHDGYFYGTNGGNGYGGLYKIKADGSGYEAFFNFPDSTGNLRNVVFSGDTIYGTTHIDNVMGTFYKVSKTGQGFSVNRDWPTISNFHGELVGDNNGHFFGMTAWGGDNNLGYIFRCNSDGSGFREVHQFTSETGGFALGSLLLVNPASPLQIQNVISREKSQVSQNNTAETEQKEIVRIFPNPFNVGIQIERVVVDETPCRVVIADVTGRVLETVDLSSKKECTMGSDLLPGVYVVRVFQNNQWSAFRVIKR